MSKEHLAQQLENLVKEHGLKKAMTIPIATWNDLLQMEVEFEHAFAQLMADEPPAPVLTDEMATALNTLSTNDGLGFTLQIASQLTGRNLAYWRKGQDDVHVELTITEAGRAALKAHQASAEGIQAS